MQKLKVVGLFLVGMGFGAQAYAQTSDSAPAQAKITIKRKLQIVKTSDLEFGEAFQGDLADTVAPDDASARNAEFTVTGREGSVFTIDLPDNGTVVMITGSGDTAQTQIAVDEFISNFGGDGSNGSISGETTLAVGATRAEISQDQEEGEYEATFNVAVAYQ